MSAPIPPNNAVNEVSESIRKFRDLSLKGDAVDRVNEISSQLKHFNLNQQSHSKNDALYLRVSLLDAKIKNPIPAIPKHLFPNAYEKSLIKWKKVSENFEARLDEEIKNEFGLKGATTAQLNAFLTTLSKIIRRVPPENKIDVIEKLRTKFLDKVSEIDRKIADITTVSKIITNVLPEKIIDILDHPKNMLSCCSKLPHDIQPVFLFEINSDMQEFYFYDLDNKEQAAFLALPSNEKRTVFMAIFREREKAKEAVPSIKSSPAPRQESASAAEAPRSIASEPKFDAKIYGYSPEKIKKDFGLEDVTPAQLNEFIIKLSDVIQSVPPYKKIEVCESLRSNFLENVSKFDDKIEILKRSLTLIKGKNGVEFLEYIGEKIKNLNLISRIRFFDLPRHLQVCFSTLPTLYGVPFLFIREDMQEYCSTLSLAEQKFFINCFPEIQESYSKLSSKDRTGFLRLSDSNRKEYLTLSDNRERTGFLALDSGLREFYSNLPDNKQRTDFLVLSSDNNQRAAFLALESELREFCFSLSDNKERKAFLALDREMKVFCYLVLEKKNDITDFLALTSDPTRTAFIEAFRSR